MRRLVRNMPSLLPIFKNMTKGTRIYSPVVGECRFDSIIAGENIIRAYYLNKEYRMIEWIGFNEYGQLAGYGEHSECLIFPSKEGRDWNLYYQELNKTSKTQNENS